MNYSSLILAVVCVLYKFARPILKKAVDDPDAEWDNRLMAGMDALLGWIDKEK